MASDELNHQSTADPNQRSGCAPTGDSLLVDPFRQSFEHAGVGMLVMDCEGTLLHANRALCELFGYEESDLVGRRFQQFRHPDEAELEADQFSRLATGELPRIQSERRYLHRNGQEVWVQATAALVRNEQGQPSCIVGHMHSIDDRRKAESDLRSLNSQLARLASFDGLTGLLNRRTLFTGFEQLWASSHDLREPLSCIILDIDHFKLVNDCHGHAAGDEVLRHVGNVLQNALRPHDLCGRWVARSSCSSATTPGRTKPISLPRASAIWCRCSQSPGAICESR